VTIPKASLSHHGVFAVNVIPAPLLAEMSFYRVDIDNRQLRLKCPASSCGQDFVFPLLARFLALKCDFGFLRKYQGMPSQHGTGCTRTLPE
jgi:hypothetical protein